MISVIIPTYNRADSLLNAARSVLAQTGVDLELLIIDDGSDDHTAQIVASLADARVRYLPQGERRGACAARNIGIREARGDYIAFQDSDDVWHSGKLVAQMKCLQEGTADIVFCAFLRHDGKQTVCLPEGLDDGAYLTYEAMLEHNFISTQTMMGKRECFLAEMFDEAYPRLQDWELGLRLVQRYKVRFDARPMVDVYVRHDSISKNPHSGMWAIELLANQHHRGLKDNPRCAISMAYSYNHFACEAKENPWPGVWRILEGSSILTHLRTMRILLKEKLTDLRGRKLSDSD